MKFDGAAFKNLEGLNVGIPDFLPINNRINLTFIIIFNVDANLGQQTGWEDHPSLCIYMFWMWDAIYGGLEGRPSDKTTRKPAKNAF